MRSTDEDLHEIVLRAARLKKVAELRRHLSLDVCATAVCLALMGFVLCNIPQLDAAATGLTTAPYGSLVLTSPLMGYVLVGVLSFLLGACVTMLILHLRRLHDLDQGR